MRPVLMALAVCAFAGAAAGADQLAEADGSLVLWYAFEEGSGEVVADKSAAGNDGTIHGATFVRVGDGYALEFDGVDDYVRCPITPSLDMRDVVTVEAWVLPADYAGRETAIVTEWPIFALRQARASGTCFWYAPAPHGLARSSADSLIPGQWHHVVGTYANGAMSLFVNGELVHTTTSKFDRLWPRTNLKDKEVWIGKCDNFFKGKIGEVRIYHRALTPFEVGKRHDATRDVYWADAPPPPGKEYPEPKGALAAHYTFEEGSGDVVRDRSGNENHGDIHGASFVKAGKDYALRFDGVDDYVDCGNGPAFDLTDTVSLEAWVYPESIPTGHPGILGKGIGSYGITYYVYGDCYFYISTGFQCARAALIPGTWQHVVGTFDGINVRMYINGEPKGSMTLESRKKIRKEKNLFIGSRAPWDGYRGYFDGIIDEVRVYKRALSAEQIRSRYEENRKAYGFSIIPVVYCFRGDVVAVLDCRGLGELPAKATATVEILHATEAQALFSKTVELRPGSNMDEVTFAVGDLEPGNYEVSASAGVGAVTVTALPKAFVWPDKPDIPGAKVLNNLVSELLRVANADPDRSYEFSNPRDGWVFFSAQAAGEGKLTLSLGSDAAAPAAVEAFNEPKDGGPLEVMRDLPAGKHQLRVNPEGKALVKSLIVRAIPEIVYSYHPTTPAVRPFGPYNETFMQKYIFSHVNCIVSRVFSHTRGADQLKRWTREGRRWLAGRFDVKTISGREFSVDGVADYILEDGEFEDPYLDGIIASEFFSGDDPNHPTWARAIRKLHARFPKKKFYPWCGAFYSDKHGHTFIKALRETDNKYAYERYLREQASKPQARLFLSNALIQTMRGWRTVPGAERNLIICFANFMSAPPETLNANPQVDFKVYMDMEYNILANHPAFRGLGGVMEYPAILSDKEYIRWAARLFRHYCIEGNTEMLSEKHGFAYSLNHIFNGDFDAGHTGWTLSPAAQDSMDVKHMPGLGHMEGRYPMAIGEGDDFLWTKRRAEEPNVLSQPIRNLEPGRLYSVKMYTADYQDFIAGNSVEKDMAISIDVEGTEPIPDDSLQHAVYMEGKSHPPFTREKSQWINFHQQTFRARTATSMLRITDWKSQDEPGGAIGQELMFGFIELAPFLED